MRATFVLFSGLPGTGKSALAERLSMDLQWPLMSIDDLAACMPVGLNRNTTAFWDQAISALLLLVEVQLRLGVSVIADSIFMNLDRFHAYAIASKYDARLIAVHTYVSEEPVWKERVNARFARSDPGEGVASWSEVVDQQKGFRPWEPGTALFVDTVRTPDECYEIVKACVTDPAREFQPLAEVAFTPGKYHG
jgi:predicted kinase